MPYYFSLPAIEQDGLRAILYQFETAEIPGLRTPIDLDDYTGKLKELASLLPALSKHAPSDQAIKEMEALHEKTARVMLLDGAVPSNMSDAIKLYERTYRQIEALLYDWVIETGGGPLKGEAEEDTQDEWEILEQQLRELV